MKYLIITVLLCLCISSRAATNEFIVTGYCNEGTNGCKICNGRWAKYNKTADGHTPKAGVTCAGPFSFGTILEVEDVGIRIVQDRMARKYRHTNRIDIYFDTHAEAVRFGKRKLKATIKN